MELKQLLLSSKGKFVGIHFIKKDGTLRKLNGRFNVTKYLKGSERKNQNADHLIIYDVINKGYRTINLNTILRFTLNGKCYKIDNESIVQA